MKIFIPSLIDREDLRLLLKNFEEKCKENYTFSYVLSEKSTESIIQEMLDKKYVSWVGVGFRKSKQGLIGELGCFDTHIKLWKQCTYDNEDYLIIEDSSKINLNLFNNETFQQTEDIIYYNNEYSIKDGILYGYGISAYKVSPVSAKKLLALCLPMPLPLDLTIRELCKRNMVSFSIGNHFVSRNNDVKHSTEENVEDLNSRQSFEPLLDRKCELDLNF